MVLMDETTIKAIVTTTALTTFVASVISLTVNTLWERLSSLVWYYILISVLIIVCIAGSLAILWARFNAIIGHIITDFLEKIAKLNGNYVVVICLVFYGISFFIFYWICCRPNRSRTRNNDENAPISANDVNAPLIQRTEPSTSVGGPSGRRPPPINRADGRRKIRIPASALTIANRNTKVHNKRCWISVSDERFKEVLELVQDWDLYIEATTKLTGLSPGTQFAAYLIFKIKATSEGLDQLRASVSVADYLQENVVCLTPATVATSSNNYLQEYDWMEVELGRFNCNERTEQTVVACLENRILSIKKSGLIVAGVDVRPI